VAWPWLAESLAVQRRLTAARTVFHSVQFGTSRGTFKPTGSATLLMALADEEPPLPSAGTCAYSVGGTTTLVVDAAIGNVFID